jgi:hypothetical protein
MTSSGSVEPAEVSDAEQQLREEIERTREDLGDTVEALAAKADVKARAQVWLRQGRTAAAARAGALRGQLADTTPRSLPRSAIH